MTADADVDELLLGYQRELTYQRRDGSFSAFGNSDPAGSIWSVELYATDFNSCNEQCKSEDSLFSLQHLCHK